MQVLIAIIFGIVEGITEWLPVSSTAHLILLNEWLHFDLTPEKEEAFMELFNVVIQLGAIMAFVIIDWKNLWPFGLAGKQSGSETKAGSSKTAGRKKKGEDGPRWKFGPIAVKQNSIFLWIKIAIACIPGFAYGVLLDDVVEEYTDKYETTIIGIMLILVGLIFILVERHIKVKEKKPKVKLLTELTWQTALIIGLAQVIAAALPGTSRSGATIIAGLLLGLSRPVAVRFTFDLAVPTMAGASLLKLLKFIKTGLVLSSTELMILIVSSVTAFLVSFVAISMMIIYISKNKDFKPFGIYRIILGAVVLLYFLVIAGV